MKPSQVCTWFRQYLMERNCLEMILRTSMSSKAKPPRPASASPSSRISVSHLNMHYASLVFRRCLLPIIHSDSNRTLFSPLPSSFLVDFKAINNAQCATIFNDSKKKQRAKKERHGKLNLGYPKYLIGISNCNWYRE